MSPRPRRNSITTYQYADLAANAFANVASYFAIFLTLVTAYLVTSYASWRKTNVSAGENIDFYLSDCIRDSRLVGYVMGSLW